MRVGAAALFVLLVSATAVAQVDTGGDDTARPSSQSNAQVRNKTTAERIAAPNPTT